MRSALVPILLLTLTLSAAARTWTDRTTGRTIEADFVSVTEDTVLVQRGSGKIVEIDRERLSVADLEFVKRQATAPKRDRFEDVPPLDASAIPASGKAHPAMEKVDEAIRGYMVAQGIPALSFAVSREGKILHQRAFGWGDAGLTQPLQPDVRFRFASLTKPVVAAAIHTLISDLKLRETDKVFDILELGELSESKNCDPRWRTVTIQHLLDHTGGWDREESGDISALTNMFIQVFGVNNEELEPQHVVRFGLMRPLDFKPGEKSAYSNFGYILLARVIEKISGKSFEAYVQDVIAKKAGATSFILSTSLAEGRDQEEGWYCYHPDYSKMDDLDFFRTEARDGAGGLGSTAADFCRFLGTYWISGQPRRAGENYTYTFYGSLPGVTAVARQRSDGINFTALANRRHSADMAQNEELNALIDAALDAVAEDL